MNAAAAGLLSQHNLSSPVDLLLWFFLLALVPVLAIATTSFTRIIIVLSLLRNAFGTAALPPNAVIIALGLMLTGAIMAPTFNRIENDALTPYSRHQIPVGAALARASTPLQSFMLRQTRAADIAAFARVAKTARLQPGHVPFNVLAPAFLISELRAAFAMGFALALPFVVIDIVVATALMSLGMFMVSPAMISLPLKLLLFVLADGWTLVVGALVASFK